MTFTFLHTADWQIGRSFGSMPADKAALLREARLDAIDRIAEVARAANAAHVLVAGDVYDSSAVPDRLIRQSLDRMRRNHDVCWHLLPGNHDPARPGGVWERLARIGLPPNVCLHLEPDPVTISEGVALLPAPLTSASQQDDPTAWMDRAATPEGQVRIGLAHGSIQGFGGSDGDAKVPIDPSRWRSAGLSYLALGDWHGLTQIGDRVWYSGTPEPDRFPDNEPGFVLVVRTQGKDKPHIERRRTAEFHWMKQALQLAGRESLDTFETLLAQVMQRPERLLLRLSVTGSASLGVWSEAQARLTTLGERIFHLEADTRGVHVTPEALELEELGTGDLRNAAEALSLTTRNSDDPRAATASLALRKLHQFWSELRSENGQ